MRIRTVKPSLWESEDLSQISENAMLLAIGLLNYSDDQGYFKAHPKLIKAAIYPLREPSLSIQHMLSELQACGFVMLGVHDGRLYGKICNFLKHQKVNRPTPSNIAELDIVFSEGSVRHQAQINDDSRGEEEREREGKGELARTCAGTPTHAQAAIEAPAGPALSLLSRKDLSDQDPPIGDDLIIATLVDHHAAEPRKDRALWIGMVNRYGQGWVCDALDDVTKSGRRGYSSHVRKLLEARRKRENDLLDQRKQNSQRSQQRAEDAVEKRLQDELSSMTDAHARALGRQALALMDEYPSIDDQGSDSVKKMAAMIRESGKANIVSLAPIKSFCQAMDIPWDHITKTIDDNLKAFGQARTAILQRIAEESQETAPAKTNGSTYRQIDLEDRKTMAAEGAER